jgi:hypothetical protein
MNAKADTNQAQNIPHEDLRKVLDYLENEERRDYEGRRGAARANHIYRSVQAVRGWVNTDQAQTAPTNGIRSEPMDADTWHEERVALHKRLDEIAVAIINGPTLGPGVPMDQVEEVLRDEFPEEKPAVLELACFAAIEIMRQRIKSDNARIEALDEWTRHLPF